MKISVGLDIGFSTIKVVALDKDGKQPELVSLGSIASPQPGIVSDTDTDLEVVASTLKKLLEASKIEQKEITAAIPESKVFTRVIDDLPFLKDSELPAAIRYASEEFIPMPIAEVELNWQILFRSNEKEQNGRTVVFVVASPKTLVDKYLKMFNMAGLVPKALETEIVAIVRSLVGNNPLSPTSLIIQMGAMTTDMAVVSKGTILLTRSVSTGGFALTRALSQYFNFELTQAEEYKKTYGITKNQLEGKVFEALKPVMDVIMAEVRRVIQAFGAKYPQNPIKRVILSGGGAKLPGLVIFMANQLGLEVQEADPWLFIGKNKNLSEKLAADAPRYSVAVGLALREE
ncbi:MAG: type IV pilus assembly protein PilM [Candidatus Daviesbacteria bacterium]|nr:type IV pilus assembly protein PilM [Candidatus Daviesbacteria bacterium]